MYWGELLTTLSNYVHYGPHAALPRWWSHPYNKQAYTTAPDMYLSFNCTFNLCLIEAQAYSSLVLCVTCNTDLQVLFTNYLSRIEPCLLYNTILNAMCAQLHQ